MTGLRGSTLPGSRERLATCGPAVGWHLPRVSGCRGGRLPRQAPASFAEVHPEQGPDFSVPRPLALPFPVCDSHGQAAVQVQGDVTGPVGVTALLPPSSPPGTLASDTRGLDHWDRRMLPVFTAGPLPSRLTCMELISAILYPSPSPGP